MSVPEIQEMLDAAFKQDDPDTARELLWVAWRIGQLLRRNARIENLIAAAPAGFAATLHEKLRTRPARPQGWEDGFETNCVVYIKAVAQSFTDPAKGKVSDSTIRIDSLEARNRVLRDVLPAGGVPDNWESRTLHDEMQTWYGRVTAEIREQGECYCGCLCHVCEKCSVDFRQLRRWKHSQQEKNLL